MRPDRLRKTILEVERKFARLAILPFRKDGGSPHFSHFEYLGTHSFRDIYFDHANQLSKSGTWVRQRDGEWESKIRQAGDFGNSSFREVTDHEEISRNVTMITGMDRPAESNFGLSVVADITTFRESWKVNERFKIVVDTTDWGHVVGEVELEDEIESASKEEMQRQCKIMDREVEEFMERYRWAFIMKPAIGKLTAYFARQKGPALSVYSIFERGPLRSRNQPSNTK